MMLRRILCIVSRGFCFVKHHKQQNRLKILTLKSSPEKKKEQITGYKSCHNVPKEEHDDQHHYVQKRYWKMPQILS